MCEKVELPVFAEGKVSMPFYNAFWHQASLVIDCQVCGRTHFADHASTGDYEEGELEDLLAKAAENPQQFICHEDLSEWFTFLNQQVVIDCPCGYAVALQESLWGQRKKIMEYFTDRVGEALLDAQNTQARVQKTDRTLKQLEPQQDG